MGGMEEGLEGEEGKGRGGGWLEKGVAGHMGLGEV